LFPQFSVAFGAVQRGCTKNVIVSDLTAKAKHCESIVNLFRSSLYSSRIILKWILKMGFDHVDWIHLAEDKDQWRAVNTVMKRRVQ
jgi:hypothetical protein